MLFWIPCLAIREGPGAAALAQGAAPQVYEKKVISLSDFNVSDADRARYSAAGCAAAPPSGSPPHCSRRLVRRARPSPELKTAYGLLGPAEGLSLQKAERKPEQRLHQLPVPQDLQPLLAPPLGPVAKHLKRHAPARGWECTAAGQSRCGANRTSCAWMMPTHAMAPAPGERRARPVQGCSGS